MSKIIMLDETNFAREVLQSRLPVMVDLFAEWCATCHQMRPTLESIAEEEEDRLRVAALDTDLYSGVTQDFFHFTLLPTFILFVNGQQVARMDGFHSQNELLWEFEPFLARRPSELMPPMTSPTSEY
ncbi:MAG TPA: thioredoxin domain-containing protein [Actinomycetota bacterium]|nr:thioredoxin domain-containing protein [Actinomycetota bacterium]